jgi:hypothetical protein
VQRKFLVNTNFKNKEKIMERRHVDKKRIDI